MSKHTFQFVGALLDALTQDTPVPPKPRRQRKKRKAAVSSSNITLRKALDNEFFDTQKMAVLQGYKSPISAVDAAKAVGSFNFLSSQKTAAEYLKRFVTDKWAYRVALETHTSLSSWNMP